MFQGSWALGPEDGALVDNALQNLISPRRGGPRFIDADDIARADRIEHDPRTTEQILADGLVEMVRLAIDADPGTLFGSKRPCVQVIITDATLHNRARHGYLEGHPDPVPFATVERHRCDTGVIGVKFDSDGSVLNQGRNQRLFTTPQRTALAVKWGGCAHPTCDRPPKMCEIHHINQ